MNATTATRVDLYHGSPVGGLRVIDPRPATDSDGVEFNCDMAVFVTHHKAFAAIFALVDLTRLPLSKAACSWSAGMRAHEGGAVATARLPSLWRSYIENEATGYLYTLCSSDFAQSDGVQWKSTAPVTVRDMQEIRFGHYLQAGGHIEWTDGENT